MRTTTDCFLANVMFDLLAKMCLVCELPYLLHCNLCSNAISVDTVLNHDFDFNLETVCFSSIKCLKTWE